LFIQLLLFYFLNLFLRAVVEQLFERAHEYANLANRASAIPPDLLLAVADFGIEPKELYRLARKRRASQAIGTTESTDMVVSPKMQRKKLSRPSKHKHPSQCLLLTSKSRTEDLANAAHVLNLTSTISRPPTFR
jgi:hypothetical protein